MTYLLILFIDHYNLIIQFNSYIFITIKLQYQNNKYKYKTWQEELIDKLRINKT